MAEHVPDPAAPYMVPIEDDAPEDSEDDVQYDVPETQSSDFEPEKKFVEAAADAVVGAAESVSQFMSERVQRIKELADRDGVLQSRDEELERLIERYEYTNKADVHLYNLFKEYQQAWQRTQWAHKKLGLYLRGRSEREKDEELSAALNGAASEYGLAQVPMTKLVNLLTLNTGTLDSLISIVGPDLEESIKKRSKLRLQYDTARSKLRSLELKRAQGKVVADDKLNAAEEKLRACELMFETITTGLYEKIDMQTTHNKQKIMELVKVNIAGSHKHLKGIAESYTPGEE